MLRIALLLSLCICLLTSCAPTLSHYINAQHRPNIRKILGDYTKIVDVTEQVLLREGWQIQEAINPAVYERRNGEDQSRDILFLTAFKRDSKIIYSTYRHLNVYLHPIAEGAEVEIRYEAVSPFTKGLRNEKITNRLFDKIEQEL